MARADSAVGVIRLSELTDETTSPPRQKEAIQAKAAERGKRIVLWAVDLDISGWKMHPMQRPDLAGKLERTDLFSELIFYRLGRVARPPFPHFADLLNRSLPPDVGRGNGAQAPES